MDGLREQLAQYKNVWIYGTSKIGRKLFQAFSILRLPCRGIVTSHNEGIVFPGIDIRSLAEVDSDRENTLFIVAVSEKYQKEIVESLSIYGYEHVLIWDKIYTKELWRLADYHFVDRRQGKKKCCFLLAGYKKFLWEDVFGRLVRFLPEDVEVCILSSGLYSGDLEERAAEHGWSYLSTDWNSVTLIQNIAYALFDYVDWIYKMDEDIFLTENTFEKLYTGFLRSEKEQLYHVGIVAPLIPLNGYGYTYILREQGLYKVYEDIFGKIYAGGNPESEIESNPEAAVFMWDRCIRIDDLNRIFEQKDEWKPCSVRFSIGFILMRRGFWSDMGGFFVSGGSDIGMDEEEICAICMNRSQAMIVCHNAVVGHFSFGKQTRRMQEYYINQDRKSVV